MKNGADQKAGLDKIGVRTVFQHNMFARPYLVPGAKEVTVTVANPEVLAYQPFEVSYVWEEAGAAGHRIPIRLVIHHRPCCL